MARPMRHPGLWLVALLLWGAAVGTWGVPVLALTAVAVLSGCFVALAREMGRPPSMRYLTLTRGRGGRA